MRSGHVVAVSLTAVAMVACGTVWAASAGEHLVPVSAPLVAASAPAASPVRHAASRTPARTVTVRHATARRAQLSAKALSSATPQSQPQPSSTPHLAAVARQPVVAPPAGAPSDSTATAVFDLLNSERSLNGLPALTWSGALATSAARHNALMDEQNTLSHQLPGEPDLQERTAAAGFSGSSWGENIGESGQTDESGALGLEQYMYDEQPPQDGHRLNILSSSYRYVGISVIIDPATGALWLTEDFGG